MGINYFGFRIIDISDGNQVIDMRLRTPYEALTPLQLAEYSEMEDQISYMERMKWKTQRKVEKQRKNSCSLLYKVACLFELV